MSRLIASDRPGLSGCRLAQPSMWERISFERRSAVTGSLPVAGRPAPGRFPPLVFGIAFFIVLYYINQA